MCIPGFFDPAHCRDQRYPCVLSVVASASSEGFGSGDALVASSRTASCDKAGSCTWMMGSAVATRLGIVGPMTCCVSQTCSLPAGEPFVAKSCLCSYGRLRDATHKQVLSRGVPVSAHMTGSTQGRLRVVAGWRACRGTLRVVWYTRSLPVPASAAQENVCTSKFL